MRWSAHVARIWELRDAYKILVGISGEKPFGRSRHRWEDNIKMNIKLRKCEIMDWIHLSQDRVQWRALVNTVMDLRVP
jgi:hypothetical protein